jgi:peptidoglycan biosynthesis protein MviN/MurJ (putative lipid II flippase)
MVVRVGVALACMSISVLAHDLVILLALGLAMSVGSVAGSIHLWSRLRSPSRRQRVPLRHLLRTIGASLAMAVPAFITASRLSDRAAGNELGEIVAVLAAAVVGAATYLLVQRAFGAPELDMLREGTDGTRRGWTT